MQHTRMPKWSKVGGIAAWRPVLVLVIGVAAHPASAQSTVMDRVQSALDEIARGLDYVGEKAGEWLGPDDTAREPSPLPFTASRTVEELFPVDLAPVVSISNEFGAVNVDTWEERIVRVAAEIRIGAGTQEEAVRIAETISIDLAPEENYLEIVTRLPDPARDSGFVTKTVDYRITVPPSSSVLLENYYGDTSVEGIRGLAAIDAQYGSVSLERLAGPVRVRSLGEFPVHAAALSRGGVFSLNGAQGSFADIGGTLRVDAFRGSVLLERLRAEAEAELTAESSDVILVLGTGENTAITATLMYGLLDSDVPMSRTTQGDRMVARNAAPEAGQQIRVASTFGDVAIRQAGAPPSRAASGASGRQPFSDELAFAEPRAEIDTLRIAAAPGTIRLVPKRSGEITVEAKRLVWVDRAGDAPAALDALPVSVERDGRSLRIASGPRDAGSAVSGTVYRIDMAVTCAPDLAIELDSEEGQARVEDWEGAVRVGLGSGQLTVDGCSGPMVLENRSGDIQVLDSTGTITATLNLGRLSLTRCSGLATLDASESNVVVEDPMGPLSIQARQSDVRMLALEALGGDITINALRGDVSVLLAPDADVRVSAAANPGTITSSFRMEGAISQARQEFTGQLGAGSHVLRIRAEDGNVALEGGQRPLGSGPGATPLARSTR